LSSIFSLRLRSLPVGIAPHHGVKDDQDLSHAGGDGHLGELFGMPEPLIEVRISGLWRMAVNVQMKRTERMATLPPQILRLPF
jgi:hypothetical protein